jgi:choice-of-anchor A domain-containing protein
MGKVQSCSTLIVALLGLSVFAGCSKGMDYPDSFTQPQVDPTTPTDPGGTKPDPTHSPKPTPSHKPSPIPSKKPSPTPTPIVACDPAALKGFAATGLYAADQAKVQGMNISHGVISPLLGLGGVEIGYGLGRDFGRYDVVADQVDLVDTTLTNGGLAYGNKIQYHESVDIAGVTKKTRPIDYVATNAKIAKIQARLLALPENGNVASNCTSKKDCRLTLTGTAPFVNRFTITAAQLAKGAKVEISVPKHATAVIVIDAATIKLQDLDLKAPAETLWTLSQPGGTLTVDFMTLTGTVVVPNSVLEMDQALIMGRTFSKSFTSTECTGDNACSTIDSQEMPENICL